MADTIDKIIYTGVRLEGYKPVRHREEEWEDALQELRLLFLRRIATRVECGERRSRPEEPAGHIRIVNLHIGKRKLVILLQGGRRVEQLMVKPLVHGVPQMQGFEQTQEDLVYGDAASVGGARLSGTLHACTGGDPSFEGFALSRILDERPSKSRFSDLGSSDMGTRKSGVHYLESPDRGILEEHACSGASLIWEGSDLGAFGYGVDGRDGGLLVEENLLSQQGSGLWGLLDEESARLARSCSKKGRISHPARWGNQDGQAGIAAQPGSTSFAADLVLPLQEGVLDRPVEEAIQTGPVDDRLLNKMAYNYLMVTVRLGLRNRLRKIYRRKARDKALHAETFRRSPAKSWAQSPEEQREEPFPGSFEGLEREVANMLSEGWTQKEIRARLGVSEKEVQAAVSGIRDKLACMRS